MVTLAVAQVVMGIPSDRRFLAVARRRLRHLFPHIPHQSAYLKRRNGLREAIDWLAGVFAAASPGYHDDLVLLDSTPAECGRSLDTARRPALADWTGYGWSRSHSRFFWGMRLHLCCTPDGTPRRAELVGADRKRARGRPGASAPCPSRRRDNRLRQGLCRSRLRAGRGRARRPRRATGPPRRAGRRPPHLGRIRQRIESVFQTFKDLLSLERHGGRTPLGLRARIGARILALAASAWLNHQLGRPSRSLVAYVA